MKHHEVNETSIVIMLALCCSSLISLAVGLFAIKVWEKINQTATPYSPFFARNTSSYVLFENKTPKTPPTPLNKQSVFSP